MTTTYNPDVLEKWIAALRSGDYKQGTGYLALKEGDDTKYCCLGVLCELAVKEGIIPPGLQIEDRPKVYADTDGEGVYYPPNAVTRWATTLFDGWYSPIDVRDTLDNMNDTYGFTFEQIADALEGKEAPT